MIWHCRVHFESQGKEDPEIVRAAREFFVQRKEGRIWRQLVFALPGLSPQTMWLFRTLRNQALVGMSQARGYLVGTSQVGFISLELRVYDVWG